jgi:RecA/RadA recombinase
VNNEEHLILIKGEDKTEKISSCRYEAGKWYVEYIKGKIYTYNSDNVMWYRQPALLDLTGVMVYHKERPLSGINKIFIFGEYIRICFESGCKTVYRRREIAIERSSLNDPGAQQVFSYLKTLAEKVSACQEGDSSFLSKQYEKLTHISPNSALAKYISPSSLGSTQDKQMPIFPFGFNLSQKEAAEKALLYPISVIEGPPGTGKTQTILNIIANAIVNEKTVAVVSNNNAATANVLEKLQKYGVDFIAAYLGNKENKEKFFEAQVEVYPDMDTWVMNTDTYQGILSRIKVSGNELREMLEAKNKVAVLKQELSALSVEKQYFYTYYNESHKEMPSYRALYRHNSETLIALWLDYEEFIKQDGIIKLKSKMKNLLRYGIFSFSFYKNTSDYVIAHFQKLYYEQRQKELNEQIQILTKKLRNYQFDKVMKLYSEDSMRLLKAKLAQRYLSSKNRILFTKESWRKNFDTFIKEYPVILSTTHSLRSCTEANYLFDYVIMDEASQVDIVTGALALSCAKKAVIVGDLKQLPHVVSEKVKEETYQTFTRYNLNIAYHYQTNSMLSSITTLYHSVPKTLLKEHYRCHPKIIGFCNQKFYNNELIVLTEEHEGERPLLVYKTAKGNHARGNYNQRQIDVILKEILPEQIKDRNKQSIGIISPYRLQKDKLNEVIDNQEIEVDTVHKYQGREKDIIVLTTVVNEVNEFVDDPNLINVAVSRAVDRLIVIVSDNEKNNQSNIADLVRYIEYNNYEIIDSQVYSVFDLLYHSYSQHLNEMMKNIKNVSLYKSENLMNAVIEKVLKLPEFNNLDHIMHQPLKMLIRNVEKLNEDECRFAMNGLTHTDFVIFNKLDKMPILVVEVDGYAFHANQSKQLERDAMKDIILEKYGISILRIKTNESEEEVRLCNKLKEILQR